MRGKRGFRDSFQRNKKGIALMMLSSVFACVGQLLWKLSAAHGPVAALIGFLFYGLGALIMIIAYRYGKLSVLQPMLSMSYVISIALGAVVLHEAADAAKCVGVVLIISGVVMIAGGDDA